MKKVLVVLIAVIMLFTFVGCGPQFYSEKEILKVANPTATFKIEYKDRDDIDKSIDIVYELCYDKAPITVLNFMQLIKDEYYKDVVFSSSENLGDYSSSLQTFGAGKYTINADGKYVELKEKDYNIIGEFEANGWKINDLKHEAGSLVMKRKAGDTNNFNTASTEFYMAVNTNNSRDRNNAVFAKVISSSGKVGETIYTSESGLLSWFVEDIIKQTNTQRETDKDKTISVPYTKMVIKSITLDTKGTNFPKAPTLKK